MSGINNRGILSWHRIENEKVHNLCVSNLGTLKSRIPDFSVPKFCVHICVQNSDLQNCDSWEGSVIYSGQILIPEKVLILIIIKHYKTHRLDYKCILEDYIDS